MKQYYKLILFFIIGIIAIWLGFFAFDFETMVVSYQDYVYWFITASLFFWVISITDTFSYNDCLTTEGKFRKFIQQSVEFLKKHWIAFALSLVLMTFGVLSCKPYFRVLSDEMNLVSVSQSLYESKASYLNIACYEYVTGKKDILQAKIEKRPAFFPYLISFIHSLTGYRVENVFAFNFFIGFLSLFFIYYLIQLFFGKLWGINGLICLIAYPLFLVHINSAGFECFNMLCSLIFFLCIYKFIKTPDSIRAEVMLLFLPLISQSRYESVLSLLVAFPLFFYLLPKKEYEKLSFKFVLLPLFFIAPAWLRMITNNAGAWQVDNLEEGFGFKWLFENVKNAITFYFSGIEIYGTIIIISILGTIGLFLFISDIFFKKDKISSEFLISNSQIPLKSNRIFWISIFVFYILHALIRFIYSWVDLTSPIMCRLGIIFLPLFIVMAIYFTYQMFIKFKIYKYYSIPLAFAILLFYWPNSMKIVNYAFGNYELLLEMKTSLDFLEEKFPDKNEYLIIRERPNLFTPFGYSTAGFDTYLSLKDLINNYYFEKYCLYFLVIQIINTDTGLPFAWQGMPKEFEQKEVVYEQRLLQNHLLRITKCIPKNDSDKKDDSTK